MRRMGKGRTGSFAAPAAGLCCCLLAMGGGFLGRHPGGSTVRLRPGGSRTFTLKGAAPGGVVWAVDTLPGGGPQAGTVSGTGATVTYQAPAGAGSHLLTARTPSDPRPVPQAFILVSEPAPPFPAATPTVNVKDAPFGAKGDGVADDTAAIQMALNRMAGSGGTVLVPDGVYRINTLAGARGRGLLVGSDLTVSLSRGAVLQAIPNGAGAYSLITVQNAHDVRILGGTLAGDRDAHLGATGEWGTGLDLEGSQRIMVSGLTAKDCWGDGFYIQKCAEVTLWDVTATHNRRNGCSVISVDGLIIRDSAFTNTQGTAPEAGLDLEPNRGDTVTRVEVRGCLFAGNAADGMQDSVPDQHRGASFNTQVVVDGNLFLRNGAGPKDHAVHQGLVVSCVDGHQITHNVFYGNQGRGVYMRYYANNLTVAGNLVLANAGEGLFQDYDTGNQFRGNIVADNAGPGIRSRNCSGDTQEGNRVSGNGQGP